MRAWVSRVEHCSVGRWRITLGYGARTSGRHYYESPEDAETARRRFLRAIEAENRAASEATLRNQLDLWEAAKVEAGNKERSASVDRARAARFFGGDEEIPLPHLGSVDAAETAYKRCVASVTWTGKPISVAEQQACLKAARRFGSWLVRQHLWRVNPLTDVDLVGRARRGEDSKAQFSRDQGRMFRDGALACFDAGDSAALAAAVCIMMGVRASEIATRRVSHLDNGGTILRIPWAKSKRGVRDLPIIDVDLQQALQEQVRRAREWSRSQDPAPIDPPLFPPVRYANHGPHATGETLSNTQLRRAVHRVCRAVGLPEVTTHGLRGTFGSRSAAGGVAIDQVARDMGNHPAVASRHYVSDQAAAEGQAIRSASTSARLPRGTGER